jgi:hypothetical protein
MDCLLENKDEHYLREIIYSVYREYHISRALCSVSTSYIIQLVEPHATSLQNIKDINEIKSWVRNVFSINVIDELLSVLDTIAVENIDSLCELLIKHIIRSVVAVIPCNLPMTPWLIQHAIIINDHLQHLFKLESEVIPVTILIKDRKFTYKISEEWVAGLTLCGNVVPDLYEMTIFGLSFVYPLSMSEFVYNECERSTYAVEIVDGEKYMFNTLDFMKGLMTGLLWSDMDQDSYWTNLTELGEDGVLYALSTH